MKDHDIVYIIENAETIFTRLRWPEGPVCPSCSCHSYYRLKDGRYKCKDCGRIFSITTDTIFHGSHIPIKVWLVALYLMLTSKGISSLELSRKLQVTQTTAYYMLIRLRAAFNQDDIILSGNIAMDEVYLGGTWRNFSLKKRQSLLEAYKMPKNPKTVKEKIAVVNAVNQRYKQPVYGMNDGNRIVLQVMPNPIESRDITNFFIMHSDRTNLGSSVSDCSALYKNWEEITGYKLSTNNHSKGQYVASDGNSSNRIEGEFSWIKRDFVCNYVHMRKAYLQLYLNEFVFRWNCRNMTIEDKLDMAIKKCIKKPNRDILRELNRAEEKLFRQKNWFNPYEFFREYPYVQEIQEGGIVYRREDFRS